MRSSYIWEDVSHSLSYTIQLFINEINSQLHILINRTNQYPSLCYESLFSLTDLGNNHSCFKEYDSIDTLKTVLCKLIFDNKISISQEIKCIILSFQIEATDIKEIALRIPLVIESMDKDALIEELSSTVSYLNNKIEALSHEINHLNSNTVKLDQFNEMIRRIERVSTGLPSYNSIFVNPNIDHQLVNRFKAINSNEILVNIQEERNMFQQWIAPEKNIKMTLVYKASSDSFTANAFHTKCDHYPKTLTLIKTNQGIRFGGYTEVTWNNDVDFKKDNSAFLFSIERKEKYPITKNTPCAIYCRSDHGPTFGEGFDLSLAEDFKNSDGNYSNFPTSYGRGFEKHALTSHNFNFKVSEVEVYQIEYG